jgi:flagellar hook-associated protein 3 FlgL
MTRELSDLRGRLGRVTHQATTGLANERISDAPSVWSGVHQLGAQLADQETWERNARSAGSLLDTADSALGESTAVMREARALTVRMANGSMSAEDRIQAAGEVDAMRETLRKQGNTQLGDRFVFAGTAYDTQPFDATGAYQGSTDVPTTLLADDEAVQVGSDGGSVFSPALDALDALATALRTGDQAAVQGELASVDAGLDGFIQERTRVGARQREALDTLSFTESLKLNLQMALDDALGADPIETFQQLNELQTTYEANIAVTASSQQMRGLIERI